MQEMQSYFVILYVLQGDKSVFSIASLHAGLVFLTDET